MLEIYYEQRVTPMRQIREPDTRDTVSETYTVQTQSFTRRYPQYESISRHRLAQLLIHVHCIQHVRV